LISKLIFEDSTKRRKNLIREWIDYQKALDSVSHSWIGKSMNLIGMNYKIVKVCELSTQKWSTQLHLNINKGLRN
jgi:hypothetical protein